MSQLSETKAFTDKKISCKKSWARWTEKEVWGFAANQHHMSMLKCRDYGQLLRK